MEDIQKFYALTDKVGALLGQERVPIIHLADPALAQEVGEAKAAFIIIRNMIPVSLLNKLDEGPGEPYRDEDIPRETAEDFLSWFNEQPANKQFFLYLSGLAHSADNKLGFGQRAEMGDDAPEPFKVAKCYVIVYDFNWESDTGYKNIPDSQELEEIMKANLDGEPNQN